MEKYENLEISVITFSEEDVITTSGGDPGDPGDINLPDVP